MLVWRYYVFFFSCVKWINYTFRFSLSNWDWNYGFKPFLVHGRFFEQKLLQDRPCLMIIYIFCVPSPDNFYIKKGERYLYNSCPQPPSFFFYPFIFNIMTPHPLINPKRHFLNKPAIPTKQHCLKVKQLLDCKQTSSVIYVKGKSESTRDNTDVDMEFRQESNFFYLTGKLNSIEKKKKKLTIKKKRCG